MLSGCETVFANLY